MAVSNPSPERYPVISFLGIGADLVFWEKVDMKLQRVRDAVIGEKHWDSKNYPNHVLVYKTALDKDGQWYKFFYAADRKNQDDYNFEFVQGQELVRTYVIRRDKYFARTTAQAASAVPLVADEFTVPVVATPDSRFTQFGFADDTLGKTETELDSIYIVIKRRFVEPVQVDKVYNSGLDDITTVTKTIIPKGTGTPSASLNQVVEVSNGNAFHDVLVNNQYPERSKVFSFLSPNIKDLLFMETVDARVVGSSIPEYGTPHPDTLNWPDHELVYVKSADAQGHIYNYYYAAKRAAQDKYNLEANGDEAFKTYIIPRSSGGGDPPEDILDFSAPPMPPGMIEVGYTISRTDTELDSLYYIKKVRYIVGTAIESSYNDELDCMVTITKDVVAKGSGAYGGSVSPGEIIEFRSGNAFYDIRITQTCDAEKRLPDLPTFVNYAFPPRLDSVNIVFVKAYANNPDAAAAYDEDYYFEYKLTEPKPGPHAAVIERYITDDPAGFLADVQLNQFPVPKRETVGIVYGWAYQSPGGNTAHAFAREIEIPASIHNVINITINGQPPVPPTNLVGGNTFLQRLSTTSLPATTGFTEFITSLAVTADVRKLPMGYYEVRIVKIKNLSIYA